MAGLESGEKIYAIEAERSWPRFPMSDMTAEPESLLTEIDG